MTLVRLRAHPPRKVLGPRVPVVAARRHAPIVAPVLHVQRPPADAPDVLALQEVARLETLGPHEGLLEGRQRQRGALEAELDRERQPRVAPQLAHVLPKEPQAARVHAKKLLHLEQEEHEVPPEVRLQEASLAWEPRILEAVVA